MASLFPAALDTVTSLYTVVNGKSAKLTGFHNSTIATITVDDTTGAPASGYATVDGEAVLYTAKTPTTLTGCTRHADGTAPASHNDKAVVKFGLVADHHNSLVQAILAIESKIGSGATGIDGAKMKDGSIPKSKLAATVGFSPLFFKSHLKVNQADGGASVLVSLDIVDQDDPLPPAVLGNWNVAGKRWIAPAAGVVVVAWRGCSLQGPANNDSVFSIFVNGGLKVRGSEAASLAANQNSSGGTTMFQVAINDYIQLFRDYRSTATAIVGSDAQPGSTELSIMFVAS